jgi:hypothetical protein
MKQLAVRLTRLETHTPRAPVPVAAVPWEPTDAECLAVLQILEDMGGPELVATVCAALCPVPDVPDARR